MDVANFDPLVRGFYCHQCAGNNIQTSLMNIKDLLMHGMMFHGKEFKDLDDYVHDAFWYDIHTFKATDPTALSNTSSMILFNPENFPQAQPGNIGPRVNNTTFDPYSASFGRSDMEGRSTPDGPNYNEFEPYYSMPGPESSSAEVPPKHTLGPEACESGTLKYGSRQ